MLNKILLFIEFIIDKFPSRKEALQNEIDETKRAMHELQSKGSVWTVIDSGNYYMLADKLQKLEKRAANSNL